MGFGWTDVNTLGPAWCCIVVLSFRTALTQMQNSREKLWLNKTKLISEQLSTMSTSCHPAQSDHVSQTVLEHNSPQLSEVDPAEFWSPWLLEGVRRGK